MLPDLQLIVVTTANLEGVTPATSSQQDAAIYEFLLDRVLPTIEDAKWKDTD